MNETASAADPIAFGLDEEIPKSLFVGKGVVLYLRGWCYSSTSLLRRLDVLAGDRLLPIFNHSWARTDVFAKECPESDRSGYSLTSGFDAFLPFPAIETPREVALTLRATLKRGGVVERPLGTLRLQPGHGAMPTAVTWPGTGPRVAICMATYKPPLALFKAQIESLRAQTHANFVCIIVDAGTERPWVVAERSALHPVPERRAAEFLL